MATAGQTRPSRTRSPSQARHPARTSLSSSSTANSRQRPKPGRSLPPSPLTSLRPLSPLTPALCSSQVSRASVFCQRGLVLRHRTSRNVRASVLEPLLPFTGRARSRAQQPSTGSPLHDPLARTYQPRGTLTFSTGADHALCRAPSWTWRAHLVSRVADLFAHLLQFQVQLTQSHSQTTRPLRSTTCSLERP